MNLEIVDRGDVLTDHLYELSERRLLFALSRFDSRIQNVTVVFEDTNGPRGGVDKSCCITVSLRGASNIVITDEDAEVAACVARASARAGRAVSRAVNRANERSKRTGRSLVGSEFLA